MITIIHDRETLGKNVNVDEKQFGEMAMQSRFGHLFFLRMSLLVQLLYSDNGLGGTDVLHFFEVYFREVSIRFDTNGHVARDEFEQVRVRGDTGAALQALGLVDGEGMLGHINHLYLQQ